MKLTYMPHVTVVMERNCNCSIEYVLSIPSVLDILNVAATICVSKNASDGCHFLDLFVYPALIVLSNLFFDDK